VISQQEPEAYAVIEKRARSVGAPLQVFGRDFDAYEQRGRLIVQTEHSVLDLPLPALAGRHQFVNAGTSVEAARNLRNLVVDETAIERGLLEVEWPGRMQRLQRKGLLAETVGPETEVWLDGGHNPAASRVLAATLSDLDEKSPKPVHLAVGLMGLKDPHGFLESFHGIARSVTTLPVPGALEPPFDPEELADIARQLGFEASPASSPAEALSRLERTHPGQKRVLICGSLYIAGDVLANLQ
jgi:dihydrofolate synthase/folylpolyglutamate synthase